MQETQVWSLGGEDLQEKEMAAHSSILPGKSHGQSPLGHKRVRHNLVTKQNKNQNPVTTNCQPLRSSDSS